MKKIPTYSGTLRSHLLAVPHCISECSGIRIFGRRIKSLVFTTDVTIIKNVNGDAIIAVYPFTPQPSIAQAIISVADVPVFVGVGGGMTSGSRSVRQAEYAEHQGAFGVVVNAPITDETITQIKHVVDIPVIATIISSEMDVAGRVRAGADILNRKDFPTSPSLPPGAPQRRTSSAPSRPEPTPLLIPLPPPVSCFPCGCTSTAPSSIRNKRYDRRRF